MKILIIIALLLSVAALGFSYQTPKVVQWEYRTEVNPNDKKMTSIGSDGWELAAIEPRPQNGTSTIAFYIFKRPKN
jgi:hypothetical protein